MDRRWVVLILAIVCGPSFMPATAGAASFLAGQGPAKVTVRVGESSSICHLPMSLTFETEIPGFVLTQSYAKSGSLTDLCGPNEILQGTHVASDLTPQAHRCWLSSPAGGVGISSSPYSLKLDQGTYKYTISRIDRVACSYDIITDVMTVTPGPLITFARDMTLGDDFTLTIRATIPRAI